MRLHTDLTSQAVHTALAAAKRAGLVTFDVDFVVFAMYGSKSHSRAFEVQLGTDDKGSLPDGTVDQHGKNMHVRRYKNSGDNGADSIYSATYFEWGWFMLEVFKRDPNALFGSVSGHGYNGVDDFHEKTHGAFQVN